MNGKEIDGATIEVIPATTKCPVTEASAKKDAEYRASAEGGPTGSRLIVNRLPESHCNKEAIAKLFESYAPTNIRFSNRAQWKNGSKTEHQVMYALVTFGTRAQAQRAAAGINESDVGGQKVEVSLMRNFNEDKKMGSDNVRKGVHLTLPKSETVTSAKVVEEVEQASPKVKKAKPFWREKGPKQPAVPNAEPTWTGDTSSGWMKAPEMRASQ